MSYVVVDANTVKLPISFTEPTVNQDGSPLSDLAHSTVYVKIGNGTPASAASINASAPSGGGKISSTVLAAAPLGVVTSVEAWVTFTDTAGNEGPVSNTATVLVDRVAPAGVTNFTLG